ncbi:hypothetical protein Poli38472_009182 [Pythium oligandrum]|uniref:glucan 1,3-beta-glucosidase n=1 Tax=Pythium oligandrum TaxID=41045 RepID=A0A8K1CLV2_PYTOL|nr:hypothetical protein Poli38472_009182 [Pythium oligandrum]|eukprot:TMW65015.1 hypothetical protein Poli38472_009182 [Pythium oligandrum]
MRLLVLATTVFAALCTAQSSEDVPTKNLSAPSLDFSAVAQWRSVDQAHVVPPEDHKPSNPSHVRGGKGNKPRPPHYHHEAKKQHHSIRAPSESGAKHIQYAIRSGKIQSRGVNLGGWLVGEHWMTAWADIWRGLTDEQANGGEQVAFRNIPRDDAIGRYKWHRDTFITEEEIAKIAAAGLNTVRVPIGYWIIGYDNFDSSHKRQWENFAPGGLDYIDRLIRDWAKKHNVAVMLSMHGAKGSQNGADHSAPEQPGASFWSWYSENVASTLDAVKFLANRYKNEDAFLGIGLLNEPSGSTSRDVLYKYYQDAYQAIRIDGQNDCVLTIAPLLWEQSPWFMTEVLPHSTNVWVEWHRYFVWGYENASPDYILNGAMDEYRRDVEIWKQRSNKRMFIGEFSLATAGKFNDMDSTKEFMRRQLRVLLDNVDGGWTFWSWRIYGDEWGVNGWSLRSLLQNGVWPVMEPQQY